MIKKCIKRILWVLQYFKTLCIPHTATACTEEQAQQRIAASAYQMPPRTDGAENTGKSDDGTILLSIILPVYNAEKYLEICLRSLLEQKTQYRYEILAIDDGSTDASAAILEKYRENDRLTVVHQENHGISYTRNRGIAMARGKYIGFTDNDDWVGDGYVETLLRLAESSHADMVKCGHIEKTEQGAEYVHCGKSAVIEGAMGSRILQYDGYIWGGVFKKTLWDGIRFPNGYWYEDMITRILLMRRCRKFVYTNETVYYKRKHSTNASETVWQKDSIKSLDQFFLAKELTEISDRLGMERDETLYKLLLAEFGYLGYRRMENLSPEMKEAVFVLECALLNTFAGAERYALTAQQRLFADCYRRKDYRKWKSTVRMERYSR